MPICPFPSNTCHSERVLQQMTVPARAKVERAAAARVLAAGKRAASSSSRAAKTAELLRASPAAEKPGAGATSTLAAKKLAELKRELGAAREDSARLQAELAVAVDQTAAAAHAATAAQVDVRQAAAALSTEREGRRGVEAQLAEARASLAEAEAEAGRLEADGAAMLAELRRAGVEIRSLKSEHADNEAATAEATAALSGAGVRVAAVQAEAKQAKAALRQEKDGRAAAETQVEDVERRLAEVSLRCGRLETEQLAWVAEAEVAAAEAAAELKKEARWQQDRAEKLAGRAASAETLVASAERRLVVAVAGTESAAAAEVGQLQIEIEKLCLQAEAKQTEAARCLALHTLSAPCFTFRHSQLTLHQWHWHPNLVWDASSGLHQRRPGKLKPHGSRTARAQHRWPQWQRPNTSGSRCSPAAVWHSWSLLLRQRSSFMWAGSQHSRLSSWRSWRWRSPGVRWLMMRSRQSGWT